MSFTFEVTSETIMSNPAVDRTFSPGEWEAKNFLLTGTSVNDLVGGHSGSLIYTNPDTGIPYRPFLRFNDDAIVAKPGLEPKDGKFSQQEDGSWSVRQDRGEWAPSETKSYQVGLSVDIGSSVTKAIDRVNLRICSLMCDALKVNKKKVTIKSPTRNIGDFPTKSIISLKVFDRAVIFTEADASAGQVLRAFADWPMNPRDTVSTFVLQPTYPLLWEDKKNKGHFIFSMTWRLRMAVLGEPKPEYVEKTEAEKDALAISMFADVFTRKPNENISDDQDLVEMEEASTPVKRKLEMPDPPMAPKKAKTQE